MGCNKRVIENDKQETVTPNTTTTPIFHKQYSNSSVKSLPITMAIWREGAEFNYHSL